MKHPMLFALGEDGTMWSRIRCAESGDWEPWEFIEGPPEGRPDYKQPTLEEQAESLRVQGGSQTFVGRGHHLHEGKEDK
jgi:hypothetical protein